MKTILISGSTGNVGQNVIAHLRPYVGEFRILAGVRSVEEPNQTLPSKGIEQVHFDFNDETSLEQALKQSDVLFLLRPPQLTDINRYFKPIVDIAKRVQLEHIVFLSVQGAENNTFIPHHKIEQLIIESRIPYTFLRPAYFMQNFTTTLREDLVKESQIILPAGNTKFTLVDLQDVGRVTAKVLTNTAIYRNQAFALTSEKPLSFHQMADILSKQLDRKIKYESPNLLSFYWKKRRQKMAPAFILVMIMLHYLPRFKSTPPISDAVKKITGKTPNSFTEFVRNNKALLMQDQ